MLFGKTWNIDETAQHKHLNQYININYKEYVIKASFIRYFIVTAENLI